MEKIVWEVLVKICQFSIQSIHPIQNRIGILIDNQQVLDVHLFWTYHFREKNFYNYQERADYFSPPSLSRILTIKEEPLAFFQETLSLYKKTNREDCTFKLNNLKILAPLDKITTYRDFYTHEKHVAKGFELRNEPIPPDWYQIPVYYKGNPHSFRGHEDEILWPSYTKKLDYELELAAVIGRDGQNIKEKEAHKHLFGLTILNDISARDIQKKEMSLRLGPAKGKDFCSIIGPIIVTIDEFDTSEPNLEMLARVNGEEWSRGQSGDAYYNFPQMIAHASMDEWILSGDLFGSGTVGTGCGLELSRWIQPGDEIELEVEGIGILKNKVGHPQNKGGLS